MRSSLAIMLTMEWMESFDLKSDMDENGFLQRRHSAIEGQAHLLRSRSKVPPSTKKRQTGITIPRCKPPLEHGDDGVHGGTTGRSQASSR